MKLFMSIITLLLLVTGPGSALADDTAIFGAGVIDVPPNVLILFDTSGSMDTRDVASEYYDVAKTYSGVYENDRVYRRTWSRRSRRYVYNSFAGSLSDLNCSGAVSDLSSDGYTNTRIYDSRGGYACGGSRKRLYTGNYLNYDASGAGAMRTRMDVAKEVIIDLLQNTEGVNFGLMRFNRYEGGRLSPSGIIGTDPALLVSDVQSFYASGATPLAESLAEAGLYFAGETSWYNHGVGYQSPMEYRCQKNYIILMTDGEPTADDDPRLNTGAYINGGVIGDYDNDGDTGTTMRLDDVAAFLNQNDINTSLGAPGDSFEVQNVKTYTIGFKTNQQLLQDTAVNGDGKYYTANSISGLEEAFKEILSDISEVNATFLAPVVPISRMNRIYADNFLYTGFFQPQGDGRWLGNIKKYEIDSQGNLLDATGALATTPDGELKDTARSFWSTTNDGSAVNKGGVGEKLLERTSRDLYTYMGSVSSLSSTSNAFSTSNTAITPALMGVSTDAEKDAVINDIHGIGKSWMVGDILHSELAVVHYTGETVLYAGTNGGMLHAFRDSDGAELWGFIPYEQLGRLKNLSDDIPDHDYFMDGTPVVYEPRGASQKILITGERRGSSYYYALDVSNYSDPKLLYRIAPDILGGTDTLGQSWGTANKVTLATSSSSSEAVFLLPGGYDPNQDKDPDDSVNPRAPVDSVGRAIFSVNVETGALSSLKISASNESAMTHSIVAKIMAVDSENDGIADKVYAPDLGGSLFAYHDSDKDASWEGGKLFSASAVDGVQRKMFDSPDVVRIYDAKTGRNGEMLFIGSGDRADPENTSVVNRFYAVRNYWSGSGSGGISPLDENDLFNATSNIIETGTDAEIEAAKIELFENKQGWFIHLEHPGEKVVGKAVVFAGVVYFTTFEPGTAAAPSDDPCDLGGGEQGTARLYALCYETGGICNDFPDDKRFTIIGKSIPSPPRIVIFEDGPVLYVSTSSTSSKPKFPKRPPKDTVELNFMYWRELY
jgi:type IV pilus assembly protein PilY1